MTVLDLAANATEQFIDVDGVSTHYWEAGQGHPVVLVHGGGAGADAVGNWRSTWSAFSENFWTIAHDMIGYGATISEDKDFVYSADARIEHLHGFLVAKGIDKANLVGNSMGGATALGVAMRYPERVNTLTLMGSAGLNYLSAQIPASQLAVLNYTEPDREKMRELIGALTHDFVPSEEILEYRYRLTQNENVMRAYNSAMTWAREAGGLHFDESDIAKVQTPTLVLSGREDPVVPLEQSLKFHQLIPNSTLYSLPHCGHWAMIEYPTEFCDIVTRFINKETQK
ncbi:alpha/beta fold hydrolase [Mycolicibacterium novocastrense]|uniref:alpha/beta fold hydrolase n=1 Tax=Mycolicibacterium novocastrense TaxID=59813 RepID=UPI0009E7FCD1|nr:alpha/beta hydrolase [Mycolicibacterium novocastrense]